MKYQKKLLISTKKLKHCKSEKSRVAIDIFYKISHLLRMPENRLIILNAGKIEINNHFFCLPYMNYPQVTIDEEENTS